MSNAYTQYMQNPKSFVVRKWLNDILKEDYSSHDIIAERLSSSLVTQKDLDDFGKLIGAVYYKGYKKAFEEYQKEISKLGLNIKFSDQVKSGE